MTYLAALAFIVVVAILITLIYAAVSPCKWLNGVRYDEGRPSTGTLPGIELPIGHPGQSGNCKLFRPPSASASVSWHILVCGFCFAPGCLPKQLLSAIDKLARDQATNRSEIMRQLMTEALAARKRV